MKIFDSHAHYDDEAFDQDREHLIETMFADQIGTIVNVGASVAGSHNSVDLAARYEHIYASVGVHPSTVEELTEEDMEWMKQEALHNPKVVAIGEIGLDYFYPEPDREIQKEWFLRQLQLAREVKKPVILHTRDACADTLDCLSQVHAEQIGGVVHCYSYSKETVKDFLRYGFYFGIGGVTTFKSAKKVVEAVAEIPMDKILLETDSPCLTPEPHRGTRNDSRNIIYIADKIADIKGLTTQEVIDQAYQNAVACYRL